MKPGRIILVAVGLLIAAGALTLVIRGFRGSTSTADSAGGSDGSTEQGLGAGSQLGRGGSQGDEEALPRWQSFTHQLEPEPPERPIRRIDVALENPFDRAFATTELARAALRLEGIAPGTPAVALISGRVVHVGDSLASWQVVRIDNHGVSLADSAGQRLELTLGDPAIPEVDPVVPAAAPAEAELPRRRQRSAPASKPKRPERRSRG